MLHAFLHGKIDESLPELDRREDALTSTVFGALVWTGSWNLLARWLQGGASGGDADPVAGRWECWFWPRMAFAEPDVVLRLDGALVVVEAKYRSDRHDVAVDVTADPGRGDQLVRQYRSVTTPLRPNGSYEPACDAGSDGDGPDSAGAVRRTVSGLRSVAGGRPPIIRAPSSNGTASTRREHR